MEGTCDEAGKEMTTYMTSIDPTSGKKMKAKSVTRYVNKDERIFTMYMEGTGEGEWVKSMEIRYKRRAG